MMLFRTLLALAAFLLACSCGSKPEAPVAKAAAPPPEKTGEVVLPPGSAQLREIKLATVETADVPYDVVTAPAKIEVNPNRVSHVVLPLQGRITSVLVKLGDTVKKGDPVLLLESSDADAAVSTQLSGVAAVNTAKTALLKAKRDQDRVKDLFEHKAIAEKEVVNADAAVAQAQAALDQATATQEQAHRRLGILGLKDNQFGQKVTVTAPMSGKVLELSVTGGEYRNDTNAPLMTIADLSSVWVASDVAETQIRFVNPGERLDVELAAFPGQTFHGRVTRLADTVDPQTRTVKVRAEMDNSRGLLRPEMFGTVTHVDSTRRIPVVPRGAVVQAEGQNIVYREKAPGDFEPVRVEVGNTIGNRVGILKGLQAGDRVVVDGVMLLKAS